MATSGQEFRSIFLASLDAVMLTAPSGLVLAANPAACHLLGRSEEELKTLGRGGVVDLTDPRLAGALATRARTGQFVGELKFLRASGEPFPVEISTSLFVDDEGESRATVVFRDISERKRVEEELRLSETKFAKAFHTSPDGITISRVLDGSYVDVNDGFERLSGYRRDEVLGRTSLELGVWFGEGQRNLFVRELATKGEVLNFESDFRFKDGVVKTCLVSARGIDIGGESCVLSTTRDISERRKTAESLQQIQRLEALGVLAGGIAHDFNNMLGGIFGFLELAKESWAHSKTEKIPYYLDRAIGIHTRAKGLTRQLLTFAKGGGPVRRVVALGPLIRQAVAFALSGGEVQSRFELADDLWHCECDDNQIEQVIDNLVLNARQAMGGSGELLVRAVNCDDPSGRAGRFVRITVKDSGPGIPAENLTKIFDPFFSTKSEGHGLGLATVFSVVHRHGGWVETESTMGQGASFHVFLPAVADRSHAVVEEVRTHRGTGAILVMDDDGALLEVLEGWLTSFGYTVTTCRTGSSALEHFERARKAGTPYRAVLLDLTVPGREGGVTVVEAMRRADPQVALVASSGYSEDSAFSQPELKGFTTRLAKPFLKQDLIRVLTATLGSGS